MKKYARVKISTSLVAAIVGIGAPIATAQTHYIAQPIAPGPIPLAPGGTTISAAWHTVDAGVEVMTAGSLTLTATVGQHDEGGLSVGLVQLGGGFWSGVEELECYADCDNSTGSPRLTANDLTCFINRYSAADAYANCDGSTTAPTLNILDFQCFLMKFSAGCS